MLPLVTISGKGTAEKFSDGKLTMRNRVRAQKRKEKILWEQQRNLRNLELCRWWY